MLMYLISIIGSTRTVFVLDGFHSIPHLFNQLFSSEIVCNMASGILRVEQKMGRAGE